MKFSMHACFRFSIELFAIILRSDDNQRTRDDRWHDEKHADCVNTQLSATASAWPAVSVGVKNVKYDLVITRYLSRGPGCRVFFSDCTNHEKVVICLERRL